MFHLNFTDLLIENCYFLSGCEAFAPHRRQRSPTCEMFQSKWEMSAREQSTRSTYNTNLNVCFPYRHNLLILIKPHNVLACAACIRWAVNVACCLNCLLLCFLHISAERRVFKGRGVGVYVLRGSWVGIV